MGVELNLIIAVVNASASIFRPSTIGAGSFAIIYDSFPNPKSFLRSFYE